MNRSRDIKVDLLPRLQERYAPRGWAGRGRMLDELCDDWTEGRAVWNTGAAGVMAAVQSVEAAWPIELLGVDSDDGCEFLNHHLREHFALRAQPVGFTRTRPYPKNDNAHIEQKNWMWPRQLLGEGRLEQIQLVEPMPALYQEAGGPPMNFFLPSLKLKDKWRERSRLTSG